jgi:hypothetical protein
MLSSESQLLELHLPLPFLPLLIFPFLRSLPVTFFYAPHCPSMLLNLVSKLLEESDLQHTVFPVFEF